MVPFAMAAGKIACASCVKGIERAANIAGGMTNLSLCVLVSHRKVHEDGIAYLSIGR